MSATTAMSASNPSAVAAHPETGSVGTGEEREDSLRSGRAHRHQVAQVQEATLSFCNRDGSAGLMAS